MAIAGMLSVCAGSAAGGTGAAGSWQGLLNFTSQWSTAPDPAAEAARAQAAAEARNARCTATLQHGQAALAGGRLHEAYQALLAAASTATSDAQREPILEAWRQLDTRADALLSDAARQFQNGDYAEAIRAYRLVAQCPRLPAGARAQQRLAAAEHDPQVRLAEQEAAARRLYAPVEEVMQAQQARWPEVVLHADPDDLPGLLVARLDVPAQAALVDRLEALANRYPQTPTGAAAGDLLRQITRRPGLMLKILQHTAREDLRQDYTLALMYHAAGCTAQALERCQRIVDDAPDSEWGKKAAADLAAWRGSAGAATPFSAPASATRAMNGD